MNKRRLVKNGITGFFCAGLLCFVCFRAMRGNVSKEELLGFLTNTENGLIKCDSLNHVSYKLCYLPQDLVKYNSQGRRNSMTATSDQSLYFVLKCSFYNNDLFSHGNVPYNYAKALSNASFNLGNYIYAVLDKKDTIPLTSSAYARTYGTTNSSDILLLFDVKKDYRQCDILVHDFVFESGQRIKLKYKHEQIKKCPTLNPTKNT